jgi:cytochrome c oxidase cbb3-type subunit 2
MVDNAKADLEAQASADASGTALKKRYGPKINQRDFAGNPGRITKMDALIAYLQMLGTSVDFSTYHAGGDNDR